MCHKAELFRLIFRKWIIKYILFSGKLFFSNCSFGQVSYSFCRPVEKVSTKDGIFFIRCLMTKKKSFLFEKLLFSKTFLGTRRRRYDSPAENILVKAPTFFAHCPKLIDKTTFLTNIFKMDNFWTRRKQYWQPRQNIFDGRLELFFLNFRQRWKKLSPKFFFSKCSSSHVKNSCDNPL